MMSILRSPYRKYFVLGLLVQVIAAYFSVGYHHADEHYQVMEFCNYKLGHASASELPWEFAMQSRSALQPFVAYALSITLDTFGIFNPFLATFFLRFFTGMFYLWVTARLVSVSLTDFITERGKKIFVGCIFLLWYVPYIGVRFSAETVSGALFFLAIALLLEIQKTGNEKKQSKLIASGILLGFCFFLRPQMGFAIVGLAAWILLQKWRLSDWALLILSSLAAMAISILADYWFYGNWIITPYNYFQVTLIQNTVALAGESPWWYYFELFLQYGFLPLSIVLLPLFFTGLLKKPLHVFSLVCIPFLIGHFVIGHKEIRFLFPLSMGFIYLSCIGAEYWLSKYPAKKIYNWVLIVLVICNTAVLLFRITTPAEMAVKCYESVYKSSGKRPTTLFSLEKNPYNKVNIDANYYKPANLEIAIVKSIDSLSVEMIKHDDRSFLFFSEHILTPKEEQKYKLQKNYSTVPGWILRFNAGNWQERTKIWAIYKPVIDQ